MASFEESVSNVRATVSVTLQLTCSLDSDEKCETMEENSFLDHEFCYGKLQEF